MKFEKGTPEYLEFRKKRNEANRKYYSKPEVKERIKIYKKVYDIENKKKISEYNKQHYAKPEVQKRVKKWREDNKEHLKEDRKKRYQELKKNGVKSEIDRIYREENKEKLKAYRGRPEVRAMRKKWYEEHREHLKQLRKTYYKTNAGQLSILRCNHRKLALRKERPTDLTRSKIEKIFRRDKVCVYCGSDKKLEMDHIIPLKRGGTSLFNNFVIACAKCNRSKHGRDVFYWCKLQGIEVPKIVIELLEKQRLKALEL